ncbi:hypothetical protein ABT160_30605 [Streptomyces sp. NPDC001941]|uniref:hypothetical protein n=1 Tax=Streptomyces sp. NPDC001941 TaxID=3154659 RepID=UPI0033198EA2
MGELDVEARVDELTRGLRKLAAGLLDAAADHPDATRARDLSAAARALTSAVLPRLEGEGPQDDPVPPPVEDTPPAPVVTAKGGAIDELVALYLADYERTPYRDPAMTDPGLDYKEWEHLHRVRYRREEEFACAPRWNDEVASRGRKVVRGVTTMAQVLRRMHHRYVLIRDLDSAEGELALRVRRGCKAIRDCRALSDGDFVDLSEVKRATKAFQWRALVTAAERGADAESRLRTQLAQLELAASTVLALDTAYRRRDTDPGAGTRITDAAHAVKALFAHWPPEVEGTV